MRLRLSVIHSPLPGHPKQRVDRQTKLSGRLHWHDSGAYPSTAGHRSLPGAYPLPVWTARRLGGCR